VPRVIGKRTDFYIEREYDWSKVHSKKKRIHLFKAHQFNKINAKGITRTLFEQAKTNKKA